MRFKHKFFTAGVISIGYYLASLFLNIVPCQISPNVPNPQYIWSTCTLNPDTFISSGVQKLFFGFSSRLTDATLLALVLPFLIAIIVLSLKFKKHGKKEETN
ncbi:Uncharacterised protein [uncultured archaeon]|nr:Uncharacterised protein [uncultured archaeon]